MSHAASISVPRRRRRRRPTREERLALATVLARLITLALAVFGTAVAGEGLRSGADSVTFAVTIAADLLIAALSVWDIQITWPIVRRYVRTRFDAAPSGPPAGDRSWLLERNLQASVLLMVCLTSTAAIHLTMS